MINQSKPVERIKVVCIIGSGRSGSTILGNLLGQPKGFTHVGELHNIWTRGFIQNYDCSCGKPFEECVTWNSIIHNAFGAPTHVNAKEMRDASKLIRSRHLPLLLHQTSKEELKKRISGYLNKLENLYQSIHNHHRSHVIIDSSKFHTHAWMVQMLPNIQLYFLHLIRDPRGVAYSWQKKKHKGGANSKQLMVRYSTWQSSYSWNMRNFLAGIRPSIPSHRYRLQRYEDFVSNPRESVRKILQWLDEDDRLDFFESSHRARINLQHTFSGNPVRFTHGTIKIQLDNEWKINFPKREQMLVTALTTPLLQKYGYRTLPW